MSAAKPKTPAKPRAPRTPRAPDVEKLRGAINLIEEHGPRIDILSDLLAAQYKLRLSFSTGTNRATMLGITGTATESQMGALNAWARAARRALIKAGAR